MRLIGLAVMLTLSLALAPLAAEGQQAEKVYRVGFLGGASPMPYAHLVEALRQGLRDRGYVNGGNLSFGDDGPRPKRMGALEALV